jgi:hypothetical protein
MTRKFSGKIADIEKNEITGNLTALYKNTKCRFFGTKEKNKNVYILKD